MGSRTIVALKKFQSDQGLTVTGSLDEATAAKLFPNAKSKAILNSPSTKSSTRPLRLSVIVPPLDRVVREGNRFSTVIDLNAPDSDPKWAPAVRRAVEDALSSLDVNVVEDTTADELQVTFNGFSEFSPHPMEDSSKLLFKGKTVLLTPGGSVEGSIPNWTVDIFSYSKYFSDGEANQSLVLADFTEHLRISLATLLSAKVAEHGYDNSVLKYIQLRFRVPDTVKLSLGEVHTSTVAPGFNEAAVTVDDGKYPRTQQVLISKDSHYLIVVVGSIIELHEDSAAEMAERIREAFKVPANLKLSVGEFKPSLSPDFKRGTLTMDDGRTKQERVLLLTVDGKHLIMSEIYSLNVDPN